MKSSTSFVIMLRTGAGLPKRAIMYEYRHGYPSLLRSMHSPSMLSMIERCGHLNTPEIWRASARAGTPCLWTLNLATHSESSISSKSNLLNSSYGKSRFLELFRLEGITYSSSEITLSNKAVVNKTLRSVHFGVVVVELINCKCGGIVRNEIW